MNEMFDQFIQILGYLALGWLLMTLGFLIAFFLRDYWSQRKHNQRVQRLVEAKQLELDSLSDEDRRLIDQRKRLDEYVDTHRHEFEIVKLVGEYREKYGPENVEVTALENGAYELTVSFETPEGRFTQVLILTPIIE